MSQKLLGVIAIGLFCFPLYLFSNPADFDTTFNVTGVQNVPFDLGSAICTFMALQPDGKMVDFGTVNGVFGLARVNTDGSLDLSFNSTGTQTLLIGTLSSCVSGVIQPDGKIIGVGYAKIGGVDQFAVARFNTDGSLDTSFNSTGTQEIVIGTSAVANALALQLDGKIVLAGTSDTQCALARLNSNGSIDTSFNGTGTQRFSVGGSSFISAVALQSDGKIVVTGGSSTVDNNYFVARLTTNGVLDTTFNVTGIKTFNIGNIADGAYGLAIQKNGKIVVAGDSSINNFDTTEIGVARLNTDGSLDTSFNLTGTQIIPVGLSSGAASVALDTQGKLVVAGQSVGEAAVVRLNTDGSLDTDFNGTGILTFSPGTNNFISTVLIQPVDGKIVLGLTGQFSDIYRFIFARLLGDPVSCCDVLWNLYNEWIS